MDAVDNPLLTKVYMPNGSLQHFGFFGGGPASDKQKNYLRALLRQHAGDPTTEAIRTYMNELRENPEGPVTAATRTRRNSLYAAAATPKALAYRTLSGLVAAAVEAGKLIRTGDFLQRIGGSDLPDGVQSWFGRHVAKAYRKATGREPLRVWAQHRTTGKFIHVMVYGPIDDALYAGLRSYKATRHLLASNFAEAA
ncbi:hypothetical protein PYK79_49925 [Streptomyces sp. ID05-04B]|uniref:hypothetical protein n=1 Tax=Streptomyces sp. ID05-04B TaxID=3028661 RepID=UPI0029C52544|nr:hypothetical protein [Streptomyces sp. ID05-04B]MDX5569799.1 hypothetical protein [Streptomyces sp. ID05-04B]